MTDLTEFKRLNFFTGFFTTARDWTQEQDYHREKLKLHTQSLHNTPGVIESIHGNLEVRAIEGRLAVQVQPGAALDGAGNEIYLGQPREVEIDPGELGLGKGDSAEDVYIAIEYCEIPTDYDENVEQPQYSGHTRMTERPCVEATRNKPDNASQLELACIHLQPGATEIKDDEIDRGGVVWSVTVAHQRDRLDDHENRLAEEEQKSSDFEERLAEEEQKSSDFEERLAEEEKNSSNFEERLVRVDRYRRLHNRGLHTPGVVLGEAEQLRVVAAGGLEVRVLAGAALDGAGNTLVLEEPRILRIAADRYELPELVFIAIGHVEAQPDNGTGPSVDLQITTARPDNYAWMELARIDLQPGVTEVTEPADPDYPGGNEIDRRHVESAGAVGIRERLMPPETLRDLIQVMSRTRRDFAALDDQFPAPSVVDVRHAALTVETLARIGRVRPGQLPDLLATLADIEQDVGQEIDRKYGNVVNATEEFHAYVTSVQNLQAALRLGVERDILTAQAAVAAAARELSEMAIENPIANAGHDQGVTTIYEDATVTLDASASRGRGERNIVRYRWTIEA